MPDDVLARLAVNGGVCMVTFVPFFVSQECTDWFTGLRAEVAAGRGLDPANLAAGLRPAPGRGSRTTRCRPPPSPRSPTTSTTSARWQASTTSASAATSTAPRSLPPGLHDVSRYPALFDELQRRRWSEADLKALAGGNVLRALRDAESYASAQA